MEVDLDASVSLFDQEGRHVEDVYFNPDYQSGQDGAVQHQGDNLTGEDDGDDEVIRIDLKKIHPLVKTMFLVVSIHTDNTDFRQVGDAYCRLFVDNSRGPNRSKTNPEGAQLMKYHLRPSEAGPEQNGTVTHKATDTAVVMGVLTRWGGKNGWMMHTLGHGIPVRRLKQTHPQLEMLLRGNDKQGIPPLKSRLLASLQKRKELRLIDEADKQRNPETLEQRMQQRRARAVRRLQAAGMAVRVAVTTKKGLGLSNTSSTLELAANHAANNDSFKGTKMTPEKDKVSVSGGGAFGGRRPGGGGVGVMLHLALVACLLLSTTDATVFDDGWDMEVHTNAANRLWGAGHNLRGQLGTGGGWDGFDPRYPNEVPGCPHFTNDLSVCNVSWANFSDVQPVPIHDVYAVDSGAYHNLAILRGGEVVSWGWNTFGQLGTDANIPTYLTPSNPSEWNSRTLPTRIFKSNASDTPRFVAVSAGMYHSTALTDKGIVYTWGRNDDGQLCQGTSRMQIVPKTIPGPSANLVWSQVSAAQSHTALLSVDGRVFACGDNKVFQLGRPRFDELNQPTEWEQGSLSALPVVDNELRDIVKISAGSFHTLCLRRDGQLFVFGDNRYGQHGLGTKQKLLPIAGVTWVEFYTNPIEAEDPDNPPPPERDYRTLDIVSGSTHMMTLTIKNISEADFLQAAPMARIQSPHFRPPTQLAMPPPGLETWPRLVMGWGSNEFNQLAVLKASESEKIPRPNVVNHLRPETGVLGSKRILQLYAGNFHGGVLVDEPDTPDAQACWKTLYPDPPQLGDFCAGRLFYVWGPNVFGELGMGDTNPRLAPTLVPFSVGRNVTTAAMGLRHTLLLTGVCPETSYDICGLCFGLNDTCSDCAGEPSGQAVVDVCGVCGGASDTCVGCDGVALSEAIIDVCGVCGGDNSSCVDCTGLPVVNRTWLVEDICGVCGGDGSTCQGCDNVPASNKVFDECGVCGGDNSGCSLVLLAMSHTRNAVAQVTPSVILRVASIAVLLVLTL